MSSAHWALWALVVVQGIQLGGGIYEARVIVPLWSASPPESVIAFYAQPMRPDSGQRFWIYLTPVAGVVALVNVVAAWMSNRPERPWWLLGSGVSLSLVVVTFAYFVPILLRVLPRASELPAAVVASNVRWWVRLNWVRAAVLLGTWIATLKALSFGG